MSDAQTGYKDLDADEMDAFAGFMERLVPSDAETPSDNETPEPKKKTETKQEPVEKDPEPSDEPEEAEKDAEKPSDEAEAEDTEQTEEEAREAAGDDAYVKIVVGDEEHEVPVKDLKRLYGQEKALTQKSMEVAEQRKQADAKLAENVTASNALLERARARFEPYSKIDFLLAAKNLSAEDYTNLRQAAMSAWEDVQFLEKNLQGYMQQAQQTQHNSLVERAKQALVDLADASKPQTYIEGFNEQVYNDVRKYGAEAGLSQDILHNLVDPVAIKLLNDARLYNLGKTASKGNVVVKKTNKTPKRIVKTSRSPEPTGTSGDKAKLKAANQRLRANGDADDAAEVFLARWADRDADLNNQ